MSVWEQRTSQLRRHMQMSSQEGINKDEPPLLNPHASIFRRKKPGENVASDKPEEEQGGKAEQPQVEGLEQPTTGTNVSASEDKRSPSPRAKRERDQWHQKSCHGNCDPTEQDGSGGGGSGFEDRARLRQSQRRSRHRRVRTEGKEPAGALESRSTSQDTGLEDANPAEGQQKRNEGGKEENLIQGEQAGEELKR